MRFFHTLLLLVASLIQAKGDTCVGTLYASGCSSIETPAICGDRGTFVAYARIEGKGTTLYAQCQFNDVGAGECVPSVECEPRGTDSPSTAD